jgi:serine/threonine-protein kinase
MTDDPRVQRLLDELLDAQTTPEWVCRSCPELLPVVRERWRQMRHLRADLDALFPPPPEPTTQPHGEATPIPPEEIGLPRIPGYEVEAVLGHGGMGVVYRARHLRLNRTVALKMALAGAYAGPRERARFQREAEAMAGLRHPNVVQVYDVGEADGLPYFTMEYVEGGSLAQKIAGTPQPARQAAALVATLAGAMQVAHQGGIVHRDLKPANVLLAADGAPKITDFGLARLLDSGEGLTQSGVPMGTPSYMAPEQARGQARAMGPAVDVYALGAILYELLTGRPPFRGETATETLQQVISQEPEPPSRVNAKTPRDLETICLKCLEKEPAARYSTAAELAADLERFLKHEPIRARPPGRLERGLRWVRRQPGLAGLLAAVVLLAAAGTGGAWWLYQQRAAANARQARTDEEVRGIVERARGPLEEGWQAADLAKLTEARAESNRAVDIGRSGGANAAVQQEADAFREEAAGRLDRAKKARALLGAVLDVSAPRDASDSSQDRVGRLLVLAQPSVDEQYAAAFRRWGLDVENTAEAEVVERLRQEPDVVVQELIGGLDAWMLARWRQKRPESQWRRLFRMADRLDRSDQHRRLRALLVGDSPPRAVTVAGLVGVRSRWPALWELARGNDWRELLEVRKKIDPSKAPVLTVVLLARACVQVGDAAGAEEVLRQAATVRPDHAVLLMLLGKLLERQRLEEAIGYYRAARGQRRNMGLGLSSALARAGRATQGEEVLQDLVRQQPDNPAMHFYLGVNLSLQRKHRQAEAAYRRAIDLKPHFPEAYNNLGNALNEQRKYSEAEAASRVSIDLQPYLAQAYCTLGISLSGQQKYAQAEPAYRKAIDLEPNFPEAFTNLGNALSDLRRYAEAEAAHRKAIGLKPDLVQAYSNLGTTLFRQMRYAEAESVHRKAIDLAPDYAEAHSNLGNALMAQRKYGEAEAAHRKAIGLRPDLAAAHQNLATALYLERKHAEAETAFRKAIDLKADYGEAHLGLGAALMQQARFQEAAPLLKKASDLLPVGNRNHEQTRQRLQQCQRSMVLDKRLPAVLQGTEKPANAAEQLEFAQLCSRKKLYAAAARLYADALALKPELASEPRTSLRYDAACSAALAGCGRGEGGTDLGDAERARWRAQARRWLRADLDAWARKLESGLAADRARADETLAWWRQDPDLVGLREPDALEELPPAERQECRKLWSDLDALLQRARPSK